MAFIGTTAAQKGPLWWAGHHRNHHRFADTEGDVHSPQKGFWWSHVGWILADKYKETDLSAVPDLAAVPELRFLDRHNDFGWRLLALSTFLIGGWSGLIFGFFGSTVLLWHVTFSINSLSHTLGKRRYATPDTSRNNPILALITFGEGWHNNHHHYQPSARQGFYWWEIDLTWYVLRGLRRLGVVSRLREPPAEALVRNRICDEAFDLGMFRASWRRLATPVLRSSPAANTASQTPVEAAAETPADTTAYQRRAALEQALSSSLQAAEDLAKTKRRTGALTRPTPQRPSPTYEREVTAGGRR
jgi:stearoyl-CoA desaturase (delta-9 desaturase)